MPAGRPTKYNKKMQAAADWYVDGGFEELGDKIPTVEGLSLHLDVDDDTVVRWAKDARKPKFYAALRRLKRKQKNKLMQQGVDGEYSPVITKLLLNVNHGMVERKFIQQETKAEVTHKADPELLDMVKTILDADET